MRNRFIVFQIIILWILLLVGCTSTAPSLKLNHICSKVGHHSSIGTRQCNVISVMDTPVEDHSLTVSSETLPIGEILTLSDCPWFIKKNIGISARMKFDRFNCVVIGKGWNSYRGKWIVIDSKSISLYGCEQTSTFITSYEHGLTISDYLQITMFMDDLGKLTLSINTVSGTFSLYDINYLNEWNYEPFLFASQTMKDVHLSYAASDLDSPLWVLGDSYMGVFEDRVAGQLRELGYFNYCLSAIAGGRIVDTEPNIKSFTDELTRMLYYSTPKYLVWLLGMNGGDETNIDNLPEIIRICEENSIELILCKPPHIPSINHELLNTYIDSLDFRITDWCDAVGASPDGVWYEGYLSEDNVHPSKLGAMAIASRLITDVPEMMQFGYHNYNDYQVISGNQHQPDE